MKYLTPRQLQQFKDDGFLVIENFLSPSDIERVKADIDRVCQEQASMTRDTGAFNLEKANDDSFNPDAQPKRAGMFRKIQGAVFHVPAVKEMFTSCKMLDCMEDIMGPDIYYHSSKIMFKSANGGAAKPWHQDAAYWKNYEPNQITVWIAMDDATEENGCVWALPGSHKLGLIPHVSKELQVEESRLDMKKAAPVPVKSGGLLIFHSLVLHMSKKNTSDKNRCAIICDYDCASNPSIDGRNEETHADGVWPLRVGSDAAMVV